MSAAIYPAYHHPHRRETATPGRAGGGIDFPVHGIWETAVDATEDHGDRVGSPHRPFRGRDTCLPATAQPVSGFNSLLLGLAAIAILLFALLLSVLMRRTRGRDGFEAPDPRPVPLTGPAQAEPSSFSLPALPPPPPYSGWRLLSRDIANPDSAGGPLYRLRIVPEGPLPDWRAGAVAHVYCGTAPEALDPAGTPKAPSGDYLIGTLPAEGAVELVIRLRQDIDEGRSQWLCQTLQPGQQIAMALRDDPGFTPPAPEVPLILVGNATGIAGLHAHIKARPAGTRNWLIFGDRKSADDEVLAAAIADWVSTGHLERCDLVAPGDGKRKRRVVDQISDSGEALLDWTFADAAIYVCGSVAMGNDVHDALIRLFGADVLEAMVEAGRYRRSLH